VGLAPGDGAVQREGGGEPVAEGPPPRGGVAAGELEGGVVRLSSRIGISCLFIDSRCQRLRRSILK
jgi:hypothetical protein